VAREQAVLPEAGGCTTGKTQKGTNPARAGTNPPRQHGRWLPETIPPIQFKRAEPGCQSWHGFDPFSMSFGFQVLSMAAAVGPYSRMIAA
jgi:hypothetical protein